MKLIIAGGRDFDCFDTVETEVSILYPLDDTGWIEIVSGAAKGADTLGLKLAEMYGMPTKQFPADWDSYGKAAGPLRNREMAGYADALVAFWDGKSRGTKNMITEALNHGLEVHVYHYQLT